MPTFISHIAINFNKLLENSAGASNTLGCEPGRVVEVAIHVSLVLVVGVLRTEQGRTDGTREMLDMVLFA